MCKSVVQNLKINLLLSLMGHLYVYFASRLWRFGLIKKHFILFQVRQLFESTAQHLCFSDKQCAWSCIHDNWKNGQKTLFQKVMVHKIHPKWKFHNNRSYLQRSLAPFTHFSPTKTLSSLLSSVWESNGSLQIDQSG